MSMAMNVTGSGGVLLSAWGLVLVLYLVLGVVDTRE
jgi:hypothetical protein